jgi:hypothetical protein
MWYLAGDVLQIVDPRTFDEQAFVGLPVGSCSQSQISSQADLIEEERSKFPDSCSIQKPICKARRAYRARSNKGQAL